MELTTIVFMFMIALVSAVEDTQKDPGVFPQDLREFVRRLTQHQMRTTQNMHSSMLPQLNLPLLRSRIGQGNPEVDSPLDIHNFPFQSNDDDRVRNHAQASSSVSVKRPHGGATLEARASAYASLKDVDEEEHMGDNVDSSIKKVSTTEFHKETPEHESTRMNIVENTKGEPYALRQQQVETVIKAEDSFSDVYFVAIVAGCCAVGIFGVISAGICFYKLQKSRKAAADVDYPAYGVTGPNKDISSPNGDRKLAQSAQMYHYQHQKQQMIAVEKAGSTKNTSASDVDSEEENEEGDYTVYECPGLAPTGEMEVKNPLFHDDSTPVSPPVPTSKSDNNQNN